MFFTAGRNCLEIGGAWIDEDFDPTMPAVIVKAQSSAYFRILERHPQVKDVFKLGNHLIWVTPNGTRVPGDGAAALRSTLTADRKLNRRIEISKFPKTSVAASRTEPEDPSR